MISLIFFYCGEKEAVKINKAKDMLFVERSNVFGVKLIEGG